MILEECQNKNLKMSDSKVAFGDENGGFEYNALIINGLSEYSKILKKMRWTQFFEYFEKFCILLITNWLSFD